MENQSSSNTTRPTIDGINYLAIDELHPKDIREEQNCLGLIVFPRGCGDINLDLLLSPDGLDFACNGNTIQSISAVSDLVGHTFRGPFVTNSLVNVRV